MLIESDINTDDVLQFLDGSDFTWKSLASHHSRLDIIAKHPVKGEFQLIFTSVSFINMPVEIANGHIKLEASGTGTINDIITFANEAGVYGLTASRLTIIELTTLSLPCYQEIRIYNDDDTPRGLELGKIWG